MRDRPQPIQDLLDGPVAVVNVGLARFARTLEGQGIAAVQVDWRPPAGGGPGGGGPPAGVGRRPPAGGDRRLIDLLDRLGA